ncbi:hypothetical protein GCM10011397_03370 [Wenyingzhuangia marina]|nr:hypothetical protein GCM10011397_03370 [Wenyingzhuangia marina]
MIFFLISYVIAVSRIYYEAIVVLYETYITLIKLYFDPKIFEIYCLDVLTSKRIVYLNIWFVELDFSLHSVGENKQNKFPRTVLLTKHLSS